jgi:prophage regulatory protein
VTPETPPSIPNDARLLRLKEVLARVPFCRAHLYKLEGRGLFPKRVKLGPNRACWFEHELQAWLAVRAAER